MEVSGSRMSPCREEGDVNHAMCEVVLSSNNAQPPHFKVSPPSPAAPPHFLLPPPPPLSLSLPHLLTSFFLPSP